MDYWLASHILFTMMKALRVIGVLCWVGLMLGCDPIDVPDPKDEGPVFWANLKIDGIDFNPAAGVNDYILEPEYRQFYQPIITLRSKLYQKGCTSGCAPSINVDLNIDVVLDISKALELGGRSYFFRYDQDSSIVTFKSKRDEKPTTVIWTIDDEKPLRNLLSLERTLASDRDYKIKLEEQERSCKSWQTQTVNVRTGGCRSVIVRKGRKLGVRSNGKPPLKYVWHDGSTDSLFVFDSVSIDRVLDAGVTVTDAEGCKSSVAIGFVPGVASDADCRSDFTSKSSPLEVYDTPPSKTASITIDDGEGRRYVSHVFDQRQDARFEILEVSDFEKTDRGEKTKKVKVRISCILFNMDDYNDVKKVEGEMVLAFSYPS